MSGLWLRISRHRHRVSCVAAMVLPLCRVSSVATAVLSLRRQNLPHPWSPNCEIGFLFF
ncbi:hypothetical protein AHAS_Ahas09G0139700 [Arachis hypogaea]